MKTGPSMPFIRFFWGEISVSLQKEEFFCLQKQANNNKKTPLYKLKAGPSMLHNILGPAFNLYLDQFLTF